MDERITVITGAIAVAPHVVAALDDDDIVLAADGGLDHALAAGLTPAGVIGDMDSISEAGLAWAVEHATIARHSPDKDRTDTELALDFAVAMHPRRITLVGGGGRLDHSLAALGSLGQPTLTTVPDLDAWWDGQHLRVLHGPGRATITCRAGSTVSLLALHGRCTGVVARNVRWELDGVDLAPAVGWGISNVAGRERGDPDGALVDVELAVSTGVLYVFDEVGP
jgi:thiamine pyrophosphokinase